MDAVGTVVGDLERAVRFYRHLDLQFPDPVDPEGHGHAEAELESGLRFMLDTVESVREFDPGWNKPAGGHGVSVAFLCESAADVDRVFKELIAAGGRPDKEPWDAFWGQRYAKITDPDGNGLDLFAPL